MLKCGQAKVAKLEVELMEIRRDELDRLMDLYRLSAAKREQLLDAHVNSDIPRATANLPKRSKAYHTLVDLEGEASEILSWHSERIPGPLQAEPYVLKQFTLNKPGNSALVTQLVRERTARNSLLTGDSAPCYRVILSISSLFRMPGGSDNNLELEQMQHLIRLMDNPRLDLRLLTADADICAAPADFTVLRFRESTSDYVQSNDFAYVEYPGGGQTIEDLKPFLEAWDELLAAALGRADTLDRLTTWADDSFQKLRRRFDDQ